MNRIKARTADGKVVLLSVQQNPSLEQYTQRMPWNSPNCVKAKALRMGLVLTGKRQARATGETA
jgi:hypothetical protein